MPFEMAPGVALRHSHLSSIPKFQPQLKKISSTNSELEDIRISASSFVLLQDPVNAKLNKSMQRVVQKCFSSDNSLEEEEINEFQTNISSSLGREAFIQNWSKYRLQP
jgi:hypothetical protein